MKRTITVILILCLIIASIPVFGMAAKENTPVKPGITKSNAEELFNSVIFENDKLKSFIGDMEEDEKYDQILNDICAILSVDREVLEELVDYYTDISKLTDGSAYIAPFTIPADLDFEDVLTRLFKNKIDFSGAIKSPFYTVTLDGQKVDLSEDLVITQPGEHELKYNLNTDNVIGTINAVLDLIPLGEILAKVGGMLSQNGVIQIGQPDFDIITPGELFLWIFGFTLDEEGYIISSEGDYFTGDDGIPLKTDDILDKDGNYKKWDGNVYDDLNSILLNLNFDYHPGIDYEAMSLEELYLYVNDYKLDANGYIKDYEDEFITDELGNPLKIDDVIDSNGNYLDSDGNIFCGFDNIPYTVYVDLYNMTGYIYGSRMAPADIYCFINDCYLDEEGYLNYWGDPIFDNESNHVYIYDIINREGDYLNRDGNVYDDAIMYNSHNISLMKLSTLTWGLGLMSVDDMFLFINDYSTDEFGYLLYSDGSYITDDADKKILLEDVLDKYGSYLIDGLRYDDTVVGGVHKDLAYYLADFIKALIRENMELNGETTLWKMSSPINFFVKDFKDLNKSAWYMEAVTYCVENGLFAGIDDTTFAPDVDMTRAMFVTVMFQLAGEYKDYYMGVSPFNDVSPDAWYAPYIEWAYEYNITSGIGGGNFGPDNKITREELVTFMKAFAEYMWIDTEGRTDISEIYSDYNEVSNWAYDAMEWAVYHGLVTGVSSTSISPKTNATRAQVSQIVKNFDQYPWDYIDLYF